MKSISTSLGSFVAVMAMAALTACATPQSKPQTVPQSAPQENQHKEHHPDSPTSQGPGAMGDGPQMSMMDMQAMYAMHKKMMSGQIPEEQGAMMDEHMKTMSPEMKRKHMQMMQEQCK